jgi:hypothetical protein
MEDLNLMDEVKELCLKIYNLEKEIENAKSRGEQDLKFVQRNSLLYITVGKLRNLGGRAGVLPHKSVIGAVTIFLFLSVKLDSGRYEMVKLEWDVKDVPLVYEPVPDSFKHFALRNVAF